MCTCGGYELIRCLPAWRIVNQGILTSERLSGVSYSLYSETRPNAQRPVAAPRPPAAACSDPGGHSSNEPCPFRLRASLHEMPLAQQVVERFPRGQVAEVGPLAAGSVTGQEVQQMVTRGVRWQGFGSQRAQLVAQTALHCVMR